MNKKTRTIQIISAIFVILLGTFFHFTFKLSGENKIVAIFSSINESVWEHLKLIFFPMLISTIIGYKDSTAQAYATKYTRTFELIQ